MRSQLVLVQKGQLKRGAAQKAAAKLKLGRLQKEAAKEANMTQETARKALSVVERLANDAVSMAHHEKELEMEVRRLRAECRAAAEAAAAFNAHAMDLEHLSDYEPMVRALAAKHFTGIVRPRHIEAAIKRDFDIDMNGALEELQEPITKSCAAYQAAHERMKENAHGYEALLALPERLDKGLKQRACSDDPARCEEDINTLYSLAAPANELLLSKVASSWQAHPVKDHVQLPSPGAAAQWVDGAISAGLKGRERAEEKMHSEYEDQANRLKDLTRITLTYADCNRMIAAVESELGAHGMRVASLKNRFAHPTPLGYSDLLATVELILDDGTERGVSYLVEVQLNHPELLKAKEVAHAHYNVVRAALPNLCKGKDTDAVALETAIVTSVRQASDAAEAAAKEAAERAAKAKASTLGNRILQQLQRSSLDFATDELLDKVASLSDALHLGKELEQLARSHYPRGFDLDALAGLQNAPDRQKELDATAAQQRPSIRYDDTEGRRNSVTRRTPEPVAVSTEKQEDPLEAEERAKRERAEAAIALLQGSQEVGEWRKALYQLEQHPQIVQENSGVVAGIIEHGSMDSETCRGAILCLRKSLSSEQLMQHADLIGTFVDASDEQLAKEAMKTIANLPPESIAAHAHAVKAKLLKRGSSKLERNAAIRCLSKLQGSDKADCVADIVVQLQAKDTALEAVKFLKELDADKISENAAALVEKLSDESEKVRDVAAQALVKMNRELPGELNKIAGAITTIIRKSTESKVRISAMSVIKDLEPATLELHAMAFIDRLGSNNEKELNQVKVLLGLLEPEALMKNASLIADKFWRNAAHTDVLPQAKVVLRKIASQDLKVALGSRADAESILKEVHPEAEHVSPEPRRRT